MKQSTLLAVICLLLAMVIFQVPCNGQEEPKNIQCRVFEVTKMKGHRIDFKAISMQGDTICIQVGFRGWRNKKRRISPGTWVTVHTFEGDEKGKLYRRKIVINQ